MNSIVEKYILMFRKSNKLRIILIYISAFLILASIYSIFITKMIDSIEYKIYDIKVALLNNYAQEADPNISVLLYDNSTISFINEHPEEGLTRWPLPRSSWSYINSFLKRINSRAIVYDITFFGKSDAYNDRNFTHSLKQTANVYMPAIPNYELKSLYKKLSPEISGKNNTKTAEFINSLLNSTTLSKNFESIILTNPIKKAFFHNLNIDKAFYNKDIILKNSFLTINLPYDKFLSNIKGIGLIHISSQSSENIIRDLVIFGKFPHNNYLYSISLMPILDLMYIKADSIELVGNKLYLANKVLELNNQGNFIINWRKQQTRKSINFIQAYLYEKYFTLDPETGFRILPKEENFFLQQDSYHFFQAYNNFTSPFQSNDISYICSPQLKYPVGLTKFQEYMPYSRYPFNSIVFIGNAASTGDIHKTPLGFSSGTLILSNMADNLLNDNKFIHHSPIWLNLLILIIMMAIILGLIKVSTNNITLLLSFLSLLTSYILINITVFYYNLLWIPLAKPIFFSTIFFILSLVTQNLLTKEDLKNTYKLATTDGLTGLYNHRYFQEKLAHKLQNIKRKEDKFSLLLIDIDFFKKFNDTYGHRAGDAVLIQVGQALNNTVRAYDIVCRYGGEEMCVILDKTETLEAIDIARKLVNAVANKAFNIEEEEKPKQVNVTISIGVANYPEHGKSVQELIEFADQGLYRAKENGRNQVGSLEDIIEPGIISQKQNQIKELEIAKSKFNKNLNQIKTICELHNLDFEKVINEIINEIKPDN